MDRAARAGAVIALAGVAAAIALVAASPAGSAPEPGRIVFGHSIDGRPLVAVRVGDPNAAHTALVVGNVHGDEPAGTAVTHRLLRHFRGARGVALWVVKSVNPDGLAAGSRRNAHGVDLNRNFGYRWRPGPRSSGYYPGPRPFSEPESRAVRKLVRRIDPEVSVWFHQPWDQVLAPCHGPAPLQRLFSRTSGIPLKRCRAAHLHGTAISWQNHTFPGSDAFVVELPGGAIRTAAAMRAARAVMKVAREGAPAARARRAGFPHPPITKRLIPFPPHRKREMSRYSQRHYGKPGWRLRDPHVIVEHVAVTGSLDSLYNTFAPDTPDPELGELPNVCSHFGVGSDGQIDQFVRLDTRCRHTVGLNYTAIGIEHVGFSDSDVLGDRAQLHASLRLTQYLRCRFGIAIRNVIGHNESLGSPYHLELVPSLRHQTHGDWVHADMQVYRHKLRALGPC